MSGERAAYRSGVNHFATTLIVPTVQDFEIMQAAAAGYPTVSLDVLPTETSTQVRDAEAACMQAARLQAYERRSGTYIPVRQEVIASAVGRALANGGLVARLQAHRPGPAIAMPTLLEQFWGSVAQERLRLSRPKQQQAAQFVIIAPDK